MHNLLAILSLIFIELMSFELLKLLLCYEDRISQCKTNRIISIRCAGCLMKTFFISLKRNKTLLVWSSMQSSVVGKK